MRDKTPDLAKETATSSRQVGASINLQPGTVILDRFRVIELIGEGGMGSVYKVQHIHLDKLYALKCINKSNFSDVDWRRFEVEAKAANRLDHPNLVKVHDSGLLPEGLPYFVMDLVEGKTLSDGMKNRGIMPLAQALKIFVQVGFALTYAHQKGVIHRDVKPSNIMIVGDSEGTLTNAVKVVDFGLAKFTGADEFNQQTLTKTGEIFGSPLYMSPEQCMGTAVDHRSDLYSLGCVMYETLTGAPPLIGDSALSTMMKHQSEKPLPMKEASLGTEYPQQMEALVAKLLEKDPANRYQDATTLTAELVSLEQQCKEGGETFYPQAKTEGVSPASFSGAGQFNWLGVLAGFALGLATGYLLARPHTVVVETESPKVNIRFSPKESGQELDSYKIPDSEVNNPKPFSELLANDTRIFHFPKIAIGTIGSQKVPAKNTVYLSNFSPIAFRPNELLWNQPELLKRFRRDELIRFDLETCDQNVLELLTYASANSQITDIAADDTEFHDSMLPVVDKFPNLTMLSLKRTNVSGAALVKLKRFNKLKFLNLDYCKNLKPIYKRCKEMTDLKGLGLSRVDMESSDVDELVKLKSLIGIVLNGNTVIDDEQVKKFASLKHLSAFSIVDCNVTTKSIETFKKFPALKALCLPDWKADDLKRLESELPHVKIAGSRLRNIQNERSYEEDMVKQGKGKSGYGADP